VSPAADVLARMETGMPGLDALTLGGLPQGRATLVTGTSGTGKSVLAVELLARGIERFDQGGVLVTCDETPDDLRRNAAGLGFDVAAWEQRGQWAFVDASPEPGLAAAESGAYDLEGLLARVEAAVEQVAAQRVSVDAIDALLTRFGSRRTVRAELQRMLAGLKALGLTVLVTAERLGDSDPVSRLGIEEFVSDNVILLRNQPIYRSRRRSIEVLKFRGLDHIKGEWTFAIFPGKGLQVAPHHGRTMASHAADQRISLGQAELDAMLGGGIYRGATVLVSGAPGTGKTLLASHFAAAGPACGERCLLLAMEEGREQVLRNAAACGIDLRAMETAGRLHIYCDHPDVSGPDVILMRLHELIEAFRPGRIAVDGLAAIQHRGGERGSYDFVMGVTALGKEHGLSSLLTASTASLLGGESITEFKVSSVADAIIVLRYAEVSGAVARSIAVLKVRGSDHDKRLREMTVDETGLHIGRPFTNVTGVLAGQLTVITDDELADTRGVLKRSPEVDTQ